MIDCLIQPMSICLARVIAPTAFSRSTPLFRPRIEEILRLWKIAVKGSEHHTTRPPTNKAKTEMSFSFSFFRVQMAGGGGNVIPHALSLSLSNNTNKKKKNSPPTAEIEGKTTHW